VEPDSSPDPIAVAVAFSATLERLGIRYLIGGSLASSVHGEPRSTNDIDVVAEILPAHVTSFLAAVDGEYYVSEEAVHAALTSAARRVPGDSFNLIHLSGAIKVDIFVAGTDPFNAERLRQRERVRVSESPEAYLFVDTAEHSLLRKLEWYRRGGEVSDRQWRDVLAIVRVQGERLDRTRLTMWADALRVADLLGRVLSEANGE
jgi:hypothetical protein